jgi:CO/xanthine dehydrogenase Mo-binding subunit
VEVGVGSHTIFRQLVARELTVPVASVEVITSIDDLPPDRGVGASVITRLAGTANRLAARRLRERLVQALATELDTDPARIELRDGQFLMPDRPSVSLGEAVAVAGDPVVEQYTHLPSSSEPFGSWTAQAAEVEVDPETGEVKVTRLVTVHDVGEVVNPMLHQGQIDGAAVMGLGAAALEELVLQDGRIINAHLGDYKLPTCADVPPLVTILLPPGEEAALKPIGESANSGVVAAVMNAVAQVTGVCPTTYPVSPESVLSALRHQERASTSVAV